MAFVAGDVGTEVTESFERSRAETSHTFNNVLADVTCPAWRLAALVERSGLVSPEFESEAVDWSVVNFDFHR